MAFAAPTYLFAAGVFIMIGTGLFRVARRRRAGGRERALRRGARIRATDRSGFLALMFFCAAGVLVRLYRADRRRGDRERRAGVQAAEGPQRPDHAAADGRDRGHDVRRHHGAGADLEGAHRRPDVNTCDLVGFVDCAAPTAAHGDRPGRRRRCSAAPHSVGFFYIQATTALILVLAANTAFNGFPLLGSILARDKNLPRQLHNRGDRLAYSNGILMLAVVGRRADRDLQGRRHAPDPALHHRRVHVVHARPDRHGAALEPGPAHANATPAERRRMMRSRADQRVRREPVRRSCSSSSSSPSSPRARTSC